MPAPAAGTDPDYDAWVASYGFQKQDAERSAGVARVRTDEDYHNALTALDKRQVDGTKSIDNSALSRGMFQSGQRVNEQSDLTKDVGTARGLTDTSYQRQVASTSADLQRALAALDLQNEQQGGAAIGRQQAKLAETARQTESDRQYQLELERQRQQQESDRANLDAQTKAQQAATDEQARIDAQQQAEMDATQKHNDDLAAWYKAAAANAAGAGDAKDHRPAPIVVRPHYNFRQH